MKKGQRIVALLALTDGLIEVSVLVAIDVAAVINGKEVVLGLDEMVETEYLHICIDHALFLAVMEQAVGEGVEVQSCVGGNPDARVHRHDISHDITLQGGLVMRVVDICGEMHTVKAAQTIGRANPEVAAMVLLDAVDGVVGQALCRVIGTEIVLCRCHPGYQ